MTFLKNIMRRKPKPVEAPAAPVWTDQDERKERRIAKEILTTRKWGSTLLFEAGSINLSAISVKAPFGYAGQTVTVDIKADGSVAARIKDVDGQISPVKFTDDERVVMMKSAFMSVRAEASTAQPHDNSMKGLLSAARQISALTFLQDQIKTAAKQDLAISM